MWSSEGISLFCAGGRCFSPADPGSGCWCPHVSTISLSHRHTSITRQSNLGGSCCKRQTSSTLMQQNFVLVCWKLIFLHEKTFQIQIQPAGELSFGAKNSGPQNTCCEASTSANWKSGLEVTVLREKLMLGCCKRIFRKARRQVALRAARPAGRLRFLDGVSRGLMEFCSKVFRRIRGAPGLELAP